MFTLENYMKSFIEKIFYVHDTQLNKKSSKYSNSLSLILGILMIISSPILLIYGNHTAQKIVEQRIKSHMYFIKIVDKDLNVTSNTHKENCMINEFIRTTDLDNQSTKKLPLIFALFIFYFGYSLIQFSLLSLKLKNKIDEEEHNKYEETNNLP